MSASAEVYTAFVSMPYGAASTSARRYWNDFHEALRGVKSLLQTSPFAVNFVRASENVSDLQLRLSVVKQIQSCDFVIAVITGTNPNVFWEVGFAECASKPIVFLISEGREEERCPILVTSSLKLTYDGTIFDAAPQKPDLVRDLQETLVPFIKTAVGVVRGQPSSERPCDLFPDRAGIDLPGRVSSAHRTIDLITSNLSYFADTARFVTKENCFAFDDPVDRGVKVRILALDPDSSIAKYRANQLGFGHDVSGYREELRSSARFFYQRYRNRKNVDIRIYDDLPLQITLNVDGRPTTSIMGRGNRSRDNIHVTFSRDVKGVQQSFDDHFNAVWSNQAQTLHISHFVWAQESSTTQQRPGV